MKFTDNMTPTKALQSLFQLSELIELGMPSEFLNPDMMDALKEKAGLAKGWTDDDMIKFAQDYYYWKLKQASSVSSKDCENYIHLWKEKIK